MGTMWLKAEKKECPNCGKAFVATRTEHRNANYCSKRCASLHEKELCKPLSPTEAAYIAAFLDGEGSIVTLYKKDKITPKSFRLLITNTNIQSLEWLKTVTGLGNITYAMKGHEHYKDCGVWNVYGVKAVSVLVQILPYMIIKKDKAIAAIELMKP